MDDVTDLDPEARRVLQLMDHAARLQNRRDLDNASELLAMGDQVLAGAITAQLAAADAEGVLSPDPTTVAT